MYNLFKDKDDIFQDFECEGADEVNMMGKNLYIVSIGHISSRNE